MGQYTPGPWTIREGTSLGYRDVVAPKGRWVAEISTDCDDDLCLIIAAPELLEALKGIVEHGAYDTFDTGIGFVDMPSKYFKQALAVIAKAEGDPQ